MPSGPRDERPKRPAGAESTIRNERGGRVALIAGVLAEASAKLAGAADSPRVRRLQAQARFYQRALARWAVAPPSSAQLEAMFESVTALHVEALAPPAPEEE